MSKEKYTCEYCNKSFLDTNESRRRHVNGKLHQMNLKLWYQSYTPSSSHLQSEPSPWTFLSTNVSSIQPSQLNLPPSLIPAPPDAFEHVHTEWG